MPNPDLVRTHGYVSLWETAMLVAATTDALVDCPRSLAARHAARLGLQVLDPPGRPFRFAIHAVRRADAPDAGLDWLLERIVAIVAPRGPLHADPASFETPADAGSSG